MKGSKKLASKVRNANDQTLTYLPLQYNQKAASKGFALFDPQIYI